MFERCGRHVFFGHAVVFARAQAGRLLRFGGWVTVTSFIGPMMVIPTASSLVSCLGPRR